MSDMPVPDTLSAVLKSDGNNEFTRHEWVATEEVRVPKYDPTTAKLDEKTLEPAFAFMFRCTQTGAIRRWGLEFAG